jgi:hypothetical protein
VVEHNRWLESYNVQRHWAHEGRQDGRRSPSEVLGSLTLLRHHPRDFERAFFSSRYLRRLDVLGYARLKHWRVYGEEGLARHEVVLWPTDEHVWEIVHTRAYDFELYDPEYAEVIID